MHHRSKTFLLQAIVLLLLPAFAGRASAQSPVQYTVQIAEPEHHRLEVAVLFEGLGTGPLAVRMSRTSPGRYALHEFAKNVWDVRAYDGMGHEVGIRRTDPSGWQVPAHDGRVKVTYRIWGDQIDGTYMAVDPTHAHLNMPATLMFGVGLERRPCEVTFVAPPGSGWRVATQLIPTDDPYVFTAPNLHYLMDSPTEVSDFALRTFEVTDGSGRTETYRIAMHHEGTDEELDAYAAGTKRIVEEQVRVFGEQPDYEPGYYTFLVDYLPWSGGDGMEHRNSTIISSSGSLSRGPERMLGTVSHEFFHAWNVERIRPAGLEPFDYTDANLTDGLWLAEGFTSYYGSLVMHQAGFTSESGFLRSVNGWINAVVNTPARAYRSAVDMSREAAFADGARWGDPTNQQVLFVSYYTWGAAIALGLDLSLRERTDGRVTLDDFMRAMWRVHGKPGGPSPAIIDRPYTMRDVRDRIAEVSGDAEFADWFYRQVIIGLDVVDYAELLGRAGLILRRQAPGTAWVGRPQARFTSAGMEIMGPLAEGTPFYEAGVDRGDVVASIDGRALSGYGDLSETVAAHAPGERVPIVVRRRGRSEPETLQLLLGEDPALELLTVESEGGTLTASQRTFREAWLHSRIGR